MPRRKVSARAEAGPGPMNHDVGLFPRLRKLRAGGASISAEDRCAAVLRRGDAHARESLEQELPRTVAQCAGPEDDFGFGKMGLDQIQRSGSVADVSDVHT